MQFHLRSIPFLKFKKKPIVPFYHSLSHSSIHNSVLIPNSHIHSYKWHMWHSGCQRSIHYDISIFLGHSRRCVFYLTRKSLNTSPFICITFVQRRTSACDIGPTLYKCYTNALRLLGCPWQTLTIYSLANRDGLMLAQRLRRWTNIRPALGQRLVFAGTL